MVGPAQAVLAGAMVLLGAGCLGSSDSASVSSTGPPTSDPHPNGESLPSTENQEPIVPGPEPSPSEPSPVPPPPTPHPPDGGHVTISAVQYDAPGNDNANRNEEWVELANTGGVDVALDGWTLQDEADHLYTFPPFTLAPDGHVKIHTGPGDDTASDLYWGWGGAVWNNDHDTATLKDADGTTVDAYAW